MPEKIGVASLVPPTRPQPESAGSKDWYVQAAPSTAALMLMSGVPRCVPTTLRTPIWYEGRENTPDTPPPPAP